MPSHKRKRTKLEIINEASEESFPTSDPPAWTLGTDQEAKGLLKKKEDDIVLTLLNDHADIKNILQAVYVLIHFIEQNKPIHTDKLKLLSDFLNQFADQAHSQKEESLYPSLLQSEKHPSDYMLKQLKQEHHYARELLAQFSHFLKTFSPDDARARNQLLNLLKQIQNLYVNHLAKEEEYVLPFITHAIKEVDHENLMNQFASIDRKLSRKKVEIKKLAEEIASE